MKMFVALVSGLLLSSAAVAQHEHGVSTGSGSGSESTAEASERSTGGSAAPASGNAAEAGESGERVVCRRVDRSESRLSRDRVCMTVRQWRAHNRNN